MSSSIIGFGAGGSQRFSRSSGRSVTGDGVGAIKYPSPFFDIAHTYLPSSFRTMLRWCRFYFLSNPLINAVCYKMAEYPVTDLVFDTDNVHLKGKWSSFFNKTLQFKRFEVEAGLDFNCYGNALISLFFPFIKYLRCLSCKHADRVDRVKYTFRDFKFYGSCKSCGRYGNFDVFDYHIRSVDGIRLIRWNPETISIQHNEATGEDLYYYTVPSTLANDIKMAKRHTIERIPQIFIEALRRNKSLLFDNRNMFHMKRATIAQKDKGWGLPMILPVLKDTFYLQILRKAQECVSPTTLLETSHGLAKADDVHVGDIVRTHTGKFQRVEKKWYRAARDDETGVKLTLTGLRGLSSTYSPKHPILSIRRTEDSRRSDTKDRQRSSVILRNPHLYEEVLCPSGQFQVGDYVLYPSRLPEEDQSIDVEKYTGLVSTGAYVYSGCSEETAAAFETLEDGGKVKHGNVSRAAKRAMKEGRTPKRMPASIPLDEDFAYILGWYAGDGSCGSRHIEFTIGQRDPRIYDERLKAAIKRVFGIECTEPEGESVRHLTASCVILRKLIKGIIPGRAKEKRIPFEVLSASKPVKLAFLRGLFDADGYLDQNRTALCISSRDLSYDSYRLLISLGCIATVTKVKRKPSTLEGGRVIKGGTNYPLTVCASSRDRLVSLWECGEGPEIKSGKSGFFWKGYFATRVSAIEEVEEEMYIDFKIEEDTTFCTPGTATKNSIAIEHIVPLRILFPQSASGTSDVYSTINLQNWKSKVEQEILRWRLDNNYIPILPLPIGQQTLGAEGKALMLAQEYRVWAEHIVAGMGVPTEFVFGGMQYSGSNVSMRILENHFLDHKSDHHALVDWIMERVGAYMGWEPIPHHFKRFKMADDLQRSAFNLQLNQAGKLSDRSLLEETDWDSEIESNRIATEQKKAFENQRRQALSQAEIQGEAQLTMQKYQLRAQKLMEQMAMPPPMPGDPAEAGMPPMPTGVPGQMSPNAQGQMMTQEQSMMNQTGQMLPNTPPVAPSEAGGQGAMPQQAESPLGAEQNMGANVADPMSMVTNPGLQDIARRVAAHLDQLPDAQKQVEITQLRTNSPQLYALVAPLLSQRTGAHKPSTAQPMPEERAPRRGPEAVTV